MLVALTFTAAILSVLLVATVSKLATRNARASMASVVVALGPFPRTPGPGSARALSLGVIALELAIVCGLGAGLAILIAAHSALPAFLAAVTSALMFSAFAAAEFLALRRGRRPVCACFGARSTPISAVGAGRTAVLATLGFASAALFATAPAGVQVTLAGGAGPSAQ